MQELFYGSSRQDGVKKIVGERETVLYSWA